jgi:hypothetical protein
MFCNGDEEALAALTERFRLLMVVAANDAALSPRSGNDVVSEVCAALAEWGSSRTGAVAGANKGEELLWRLVW